MTQTLTRLFLSALAAFLPVSAQTFPYLEAPVADSYIRVRLANSPAKSLEWDIPENRREVFRRLPDGKLFLTHDSIYLTYPQLNPLKTQATASATEADDPAHATVGNLIAQILSVLVSVAPTSPGLADLTRTFGIMARPPSSTEPALAICGATDSASTNVAGLVKNLYGPSVSPKALGEKVKAWADGIDDAFAARETGPSAIRKGIELITTDAGELDESTKTADLFVKRIKECAAITVTPADKPAPAPPATKPDPPEKPKGDTAEEQTAYVTALEKYGAEMEAYLRYEHYEDDLEAYNSYANYHLYQLALLADPDRRIQEIKSVAATMRKLAQQLEDGYADPRRWVSPGRGVGNSDFVIGPAIAPTLEKLQNATIKVVRADFAVNTVTGAISVTNPEAGGGTLTVRRYSRFAVETGVGAVFGTVKRPTYSASKNADGKNEVVRVPEGSVSVNPTLMVNFVCRCGTGALTPMLQIGAATSKTLPAVLVGGGLRLFGLGKGDIAIGGGAMVAWPKDLQKLKVGSIVENQAVIDADLGYSSQPKIGGYFTIQYKF